MFTWQGEAHLTKHCRNRRFVKHEPTTNRTRQACVHQADLFKPLR